MPGLTLRDLAVHVPGLAQPVLDIPHLSIPGGGHVAVTGASGSGKTTLLNMLIGLDRPGQGAVDWFGTDITRLTEARRDRWRAINVGLVMQEFHLFPGLSAIENILLPHRLIHWRLPDGIRNEARRLLARVGLADRADQSIETLSRGQMQRIAVARALVGHPVILAADEPTASLDMDSGAEIAALLVELAADCGATLIVASHDPRLIGGMQRVLRLEAGRLTGA